MPATLSLQALSAARVEYKIFDAGGKITDFDTISRSSRRAVERLAAKTNLTAVDLYAVIEKCEFVQRQQNRAQTIILPDAPPPAPIAIEPPTTFTVSMRGLRQPGLIALDFTAATPAEAAEQALKHIGYAFPEPILKWDDPTQLAVCDIDYHTIEKAHRVPPHVLYLWASQLQPTPFAYHVSHGGGMKLYYAKRDGVNADELAAVAAVAWLQVDPRATVDICKNSRHPLYPRGRVAGEQEHCGHVVNCTGNANTAAVRQWFAREADPQAVSDWLEERGLHRGQRLPHTDCPIEPYAESGDGPVMIGESGIYCFVCNARGRTVTVASRHAGFVPWSTIVGGVNSTVYNLARNFTHWEHARLVLSGIITLDDNTLRLAFSAVLKSIHGVDDPRIPLVFTKGRDIIRTQGRWQTADATITYSRDIGPILATMPACMRLPLKHGEKDKPVTCAEKVSRFQQPGVNLESYGYPHLTPVRGFKVYGHHLAYTDGRLPVLVMPQVYRNNTKLAPKYIPTTQRTEESEARAWAIVERCYPGVNIGYVKLLIAIKGCAEGHTSQAPFLYVHGPTGSAKSSTAMLAASICGDVAAEIVWDRDLNRFRSSVRDAMDMGSIVVVNEIIKDAAACRVEPIAAMDPLLGMTANSLSHKLFLGPVPLGNVPALVCADATNPQGFSSDPQLGRRLIYVRLSQRVEWRDSLRENGIADPGKFRESSEDYAHAANIILSSIVDEFFSTKREIEDIANAIGFQTLEKSEGKEESDEELKRFAKLVDHAPDISGDVAEMYSPNGGWKCIKYGSCDALHDAWCELADAQAGPKWGISRRCDSADWSKLLASDTPVFFDARMARRDTLVVRFRSGGSAKKPHKVGGWFV